MIRTTITILAASFGLSGFASAQTILQSMEGTYAGARFGTNVSLVGDVNHDGLDDYAATAPGRFNQFGNDPNAYVRVLSGLDGSLLYELHGPVAPQSFAASIAGPGDVNLDGTPDILVGATPNSDWRRGNAFPFSGATGSVISFSLGMAPSNNFGVSVSGAGDINADGRPDFAVGANSHSIGMGAVFLLTVPAAGLVNTVLRSYHGVSINARLGTSLLNAGDLDSDGTADLVATSPFFLNAGLVGFANAFSGATGAKIHHFGGFASGDTIGYSVGAVGDIDGDAISDIGIGSPSAQYAAIFSGASGLTLRTHSDAVGTLFGSSIDGVGDLNGDGRGDYAVGRPGPFMSPGSVQIRSGMSGSVLFVLTEPPGSPEQFGQSVAGGSDLNGDGKLDLVVGEPTQLLSPQSVFGRVYVISLQ